MKTELKPLPPAKFVILNGKYSWSNEDGWVSCRSESITEFTREERDTYRLPIGGMWVARRLTGK